MMLDGLDHNTPVTLFIAGIMVVLTAACSLKFVSPLSLYFSFPLILQGQVWRLLTHFFFISSSFSIIFFIQLLMLLRYARDLEERNFRNKPADFAYMLLLCFISMTLSAISFGYTFMASAFRTFLICVWSRRLGQAEVLFMGIISFRAAYLPFLLLLFSFFEGDVEQDLIGIFFGHIYTFFVDIMPKLTKSEIRIFKTPRILLFLFGQEYVPPMSLHHSLQVAVDKDDDCVVITGAGPTIRVRHPKKVIENPSEELQQQQQQLEQPTQPRESIEISESMNAANMANMSNTTGATDATAATTATEDIEIKSIVEIEKITDESNVTNMNSIDTSSTSTSPAIISSNTVNLAHFVSPMNLLNSPTSPLPNASIMEVRQRRLAALGSLYSKQPQTPLPNTSLPNQEGQRESIDTEVKVETKVEEILTNETEKNTFLQKATEVIQQDLDRTREHTHNYDDNQQDEVDKTNEVFGVQSDSVISEHEHELEHEYEQVREQEQVQEQDQGSSESQTSKEDYSKTESRLELNTELDLETKSDINGDINSDLTSELSLTTEVKTELDTKLTTDTTAESISIPHQLHNDIIFSGDGDGDGDGDSDGDGKDDSSHQPHSDLPISTEVLEQQDEHEQQTEHQRLNEHEQQNEEPNENNYILKKEEDNDTFSTNTQTD